MVSLSAMRIETSHDIPSKLMDRDAQYNAHVTTA